MRYGMPDVGRGARARMGVGHEKGWRPQKQPEAAKMKKPFSYSAWAKLVAAACLESDLACGFEVANETPDREKAMAAMKKLITSLRKQGQAQKGGGYGL